MFDGRQLRDYYSHSESLPTSFSSEKLIRTIASLQVTSLQSIAICAMRFWSLLPVILALQNTLDATASIAKRSIPSGTPGAILTPDFVETVQQIVDADEIPGLTLAVVYKNGSSELGAWGIKSEDGTKMTTDVRYIIAAQ
jgi:hypothetical protein